jgi:pimeloyl-ACP methyl ester carboxylesterase
MEKLIIGNTEQWIYAKGDHSKPIQFFIHGGPGFTELGAHNWFTRPLEEHFLVVHWDQRGAGRSFNKNLPVEAMTVEQLVNDAHEVILYILKKYKKEKVLLAAHSMGTVIGFNLIEKYPHLFYAYVGISQIVHRGIEEMQSYEKAIMLAENSGNKRAIAELKKIQPPKNGIYFDFSELAVQRNWLVKLGGFTPRKMIAWKTYLAVFLTWEYSLKVRFNMFKSMKFSIESMWNDFSKTDYLSCQHTINVPIFFLMGRHDCITFAELSEKLMLNISAPVKQVIIFEDSGHLLCYEEKEKYIEFIKSVRKYIEC